LKDWFIESKIAQGSKQALHGNTWRRLPRRCWRSAIATGPSSATCFPRIDWLDGCDDEDRRCSKWTSPRTPNICSRWGVVVVVDCPKAVSPRRPLGRVASLSMRKRNKRGPAGAGGDLARRTRAASSLSSGWRGAEAGRLPRVQDQAQVAGLDDGLASSRGAHGSAVQSGVSRVAVLRRRQTELQELGTCTAGRDSRHRHRSRPLVPLAESGMSLPLLLASVCSRSATACAACGRARAHLTSVCYRMQHLPAFGRADGFCRTD